MVDYFDKIIHLVTLLQRCCYWAILIWLIPLHNLVLLILSKSITTCKKWMKNFKVILISARIHILVIYEIWKLNKLFKKYIIKNFANPFFSTTLIYMGNFLRNRYRSFVSLEKSLNGLWCYSKNPPFNGELKDFTNTIFNSDISLDICWMNG